MYTELAGVLAQARYRLTTPRKAVFSVLFDQHEPVSIRQLSDNCPDIDRVSIYRTIELFVTLGIVAPVPTGWKQRYELAEPFKPHHHHLECTACGVVVDSNSSELEQLIHTVADRHRFAVTSHAFELRGLCADCQP